MTLQEEIRQAGSQAVIAELWFNLKVILKIAWKFFDGTLSITVYNKSK